MQTTMTHIYICIFLATVEQLFYDNRHYTPRGCPFVILSTRTNLPYALYNPEVNGTFLTVHVSKNTSTFLDILSIFSLIAAADAYSHKLCLYAQNSYSAYFIN